MTTATRKKSDPRTVLFERVASEGIATVLRDVLNMLDNVNVAVTADDLETATLLRDQIRETMRHRHVMSQPVFNG